MIVLIENCFHWVGFHLTTFLLEEGLAVDGVDHIDTNKKEHFSMFVGRNDHFKLLNERETETETKYDIILKVIKQDDNHSENISVSLQRLTSSRNNSQMTTIHLPLIVGKWMPLDDIDHQSNIFNSTYLLENAIHINAFLQALHQWIQRDTLLRKKIFLMPSKKDELSNGVHENDVYLRDDKINPQNIQEILNHFNRFKDLY